MISSAQNVRRPKKIETGQAQIADSSEQQVSNWRALGYFPGNTFLVLSAALVRIGKTASPKLWRMKLPEAAE